MSTAIASLETSLGENARSRPTHVEPVPAPMRQESFSELERLGTPVAFARGRTVVEEGDPANYLFKVTSGALRTVRLLPDGRRSVINFLLPGDFFGLAENGTYAHSIEVLADASLVRYPKHRFEALIDSDPKAGHCFLELLCEQLSQAQDRLLLLGRKSAIERMATFLLTMADRIAGRRTGSSTIVLPMNRTDVADYLGLTVETVCRLLTQLRKKGVIELPMVNHIVLRDRERLEEMSEREI